MYGCIAFIISFYVVVTASDPFYFDESFAVSPPFPLQGIYNNHSDWSLQKTIGYESVKSISECLTQQHQFLSPHIAAADYISDGKTLNATLWLSSPFKVPSISSSSGLKQIERTYAMLIHIDSAYDIGQNYQSTIQWSSLTNTWSKITKKSSPPFVVKTNNEQILAQKNNYTDFFRSGKSYVDLSLNLALIGYPSQYSIISYASDTYLTRDNHICHLKDITSVVHIPPPEFIISTLPNSVNLFPGENKSIVLQIKSNTNLNSNVTIYTDHTEDKNIMITPIPRVLPIIPSGIASSLLETKASEDAKAHPYTIPIYISISFPTAVANWLSGTILANPQSAIINKLSNLTITVHQPLSFQEQVKNIWESWGAPINGFVGIITAICGGGIAGLVYKKLRHNKKREKRHLEKK